MARKVYISSDMSVDEELSDIAEINPLLALMWPWFLTAFDDWGRADASPKRLKNLIFQANELITIDLINQALQAYGKRLVTMYQVSGKWYMYIDPEKWFKYQTHIRKEKREKDSSKIPPPPDENSAQMREFTRDDENERANLANRTPSPSPSLSPSLSNDLGSSGGMGGNSPYSIFEKQGFGKIDEITAQFISDAIDEYTEDWVRRAMIEAVRQGIKKWSYIDNGILKRWKETGHPEPWTLEKPKVNTSSHGKQNGIGNVAQFRGQRARPQMEVFNADAPPPPSKDELVAMWQAARQLDGKPPLSDSEIADRLAQERGRQRA